MGNLISIYTVGLVKEDVTIDSAIDGMGMGNGVYVSGKLDLDGVVDEFSLQVDYENAASLDGNFVLEVSNDGKTYAPLQTVNKTEAGTGGHFYDIGGTGAGYLRLKIELTTGSLDLTQALFRGKRRR